MSAAARDRHPVDRLPQPLRAGVQVDLAGSERLVSEQSLISSRVAPEADTLVAKECRAMCG